MAIRIITDSTSDISREEAKRKGISIVPLKVIFDDKEYREGIEITMDRFYQMLAEAQKLPTTSQPSPDEFLTHFIEAKQAGDSVIVILISGKLSGTVQSATIAKEMADYSPIYIIDSLNAITGLRLLVEHALKLKDEGVAVEQIANEINQLKERVILLAMVDTLEYLYKGGRLSRSSAILGSLLKFKPIITLSDGLVGVVGKARGVNKAIAKILEVIDEIGEIDTNYPVNFGYTAENDKGLLLKEKVSEKYGMVNTALYPVGCVIGTHAGPGASVITFVKK